MNPPRQTEYRALSLLEALAAGHPPVDADATAAVFRAWPAPAAKAARLLAAHANAARGRDVLWLIGVEVNGQGPGADFARFPDWLTDILPFFDGLSPRVTGLKIPLPPVPGRRAAARTAVALHVETSRAPFVVRTGKGPKAWEVPWADAGGGNVRTAGRLELVKLLAPLQEVPTLEILEADLTFYKNPHSYSNKTTFRWTLDGALYVVPRGEDRVIIPLHRCRGSLTGSAERSFKATAADLNFTADKNSPAVRLTESAILVEGLGRIFVYCSGATVEPELPLNHALTFLLDLLPAGSERAATVSTTVRPAQVTESNQAGRWKL